MDPKTLHGELRFRSSRSGGSGGQHVNKVETKVELRFSLEGSALLTPEQKQRIRESLAKRLNKDGILVIAASRERSQLLNKQAAIRQFDRLIEKALRPVKKRRPTGKLKAHPEKRLQAKRRRSEKKTARRKAIPGKEDGLLFFGHFLAIGA
ncbi:MAG: aminoacyl-tRNA hydrolase [Phaeodactylibacter sp.]|nr:aminoacyl-tRNA hydrolase [Phaeodactylibacter sp.]MCB9277031.1 aminoacyl-tRNA hydrolase [Lewinellaceae bacterium]